MALYYGFNMTATKKLRIAIKYTNPITTRVETIGYWENHIGLYNLINDLFHEYMSKTGNTTIYFNYDDIQLIINNLNTIDYTGTYETLQDDLDDWGDIAKQYKQPNLLKSSIFCSIQK